MSNFVRGVAVFLVYFFLAPPIAAILIAAALFASSPPAAGSSASTTGLLYAGMALLTAYSLGALPSLATGLVAAFAGGRIRKAWVWAGLAAVVGGCLAWALGAGNWAKLPLQPQDLQVGLVAFGGVTSLICALICLAFRPRPVPAALETAPQAPGP